MSGKAELTLREMDTHMTSFQQHERAAERFETHCVTPEHGSAKVEQLRTDMGTMQKPLKRLLDMERKIDNLTSMLT